MITLKFLMFGPSGTSIMNWLFVIELLVLLGAAVFSVLAFVLALKDPQDRLFLVCQAFWKGFRLSNKGYTSMMYAAGILQGSPAAENAEGIVPVMEEVRATAKIQKETAKPVKMQASGEATLAVEVIPEAQFDRIIAPAGEVVRVEVTSPAAGGMANKIVTDLLAQRLSLQAHQIKLTTGHYQSQKTFRLIGLDQESVNNELGIVPAL